MDGMVLANLVFVFSLLALSLIALFLIMFACAMWFLIYIFSDAFLCVDILLVDKFN